MRQRVLVARDLSNDRRNLWRESEPSIVDEEAAYTAKVNASEKILDINVKDETPPFMHIRVRNDSSNFPKPVRSLPKSAVNARKFTYALAQPFSKTLL